ncbi:hypothetical protein SELMODRAFT_443711 [Selaginella moellendorffii]|uniref:Uncharacterized protein n=1 Tax=Selaginella moellendorffii TaxID=88036 RepID=D8S3T4_SELML|nr:uncharacterized protein LOC9657816 [Selaginella moellendorffii]EFJ20810.1 hypothetical protein SELMODRAFT_443711 [Selaginella moellendorffii]|eukprot:XP_002978153.1 uncharacterized protein LOC9657816 [Selaginella moellendorffii]
MGSSQHERLKRNLYSTSGMHLLSAESSDLSIPMEMQRQILHRPCPAALNFHSTIAWLRRDSIPRRTSSSPGILHNQLEFGGPRLLPSTDSLPATSLPVPANAFAPPPASEEAAVLRIQALYRGSRVRRSAIANKKCVVKVQATYRMWRDRSSYRRMQRAAGRIQQSFRAWRERRLEALEQMLLLERRSALVIQAHARGLLVRRWRRELEQEKRVQAAAATAIQAFYRGWQTRRKMEQEKRAQAAAATAIQAFYRGWQTRRKMEQEKRVQAAAATAIQTFYRGWQTRRKMEQEKRAQAAAATAIQAFYRGWQTRRKMEQEKRAQAAVATAIQAFYRGLQTRRKMEQEKRVQAAAATAIQAFYRGWQTRRKLEQEKRAHAAGAATIQAFYRGLQTRRRYLLAKSSAGRIQAAYRTWRLSLKREMAANVIQRFVRRRKEAISRPEPMGATTEDWNTVRVEHLDQCLDTCLAALNPPLPLERRPSSSPDHTHQSLNEKRLQQVARVFLLQHHIALQQQRAKNAPPFPPNRSHLQNSQNHYRNSHVNTNASNTTTISKNRIGDGDVVLDVHYLLEEVRKLGASSGSVVYMQNDDSTLFGSANHEIIDFKRMNALLVVFVAVVVYTRSICQEVFVWAKQSTKK